MTNYWKAIYEATSREFEDSLLKQVGRTLNGQEVSEEQVDLAAQSVVRALRLNSDDSVIDLCCGNGVITRRLAPHVRGIVGVDFSAGLIAAAVRHSGAPNVRYVNADVLDLPGGYFGGLRKVVMYEALQHFSEVQCASLLDLLAFLERGSLVFFGGIPDRERLRVYYDTGEKFEFYLRREAEGRPHMGRWWLEEEIAEPATQRGFEVVFLAQDPFLYKSHYCFDLLLKKR
jgi:cyclopropane fatty-acyl-phospholipid synthase-like methyltransferase